MATHDYVIANGTGAAVRSDLNNALAAIVSNNSGSSEPGTTYAYQWWADTNANVLKLRNSANDGWITLRELDGTMLIEDGSASTPGLAFADDTNTGIFSGDADEIGFATGGAERLKISTSEAVFNDVSNDIDFRVESNGNTHMLFVDAGNDRVGIGDSTPTKPLTLGTSTPVILLDDQSSRTLEVRGPSSTHTASVLTTSNHDLSFGTNDTERARIDSSGRLLVGTSSNIGAGGDNRDTIIGVSASGAGLLLGRNDSTVSNGNNIGKIQFWGNDANGTYEQCASIVAEADADHGDGAKPTRLVFSTTASGASSPTEQLRINSNGDVLFKQEAGSNYPEQKLKWSNDNSTSNGFFISQDSDRNGKIFHQQGLDILFGTSNTERVRIDSSGRLLVNTSSSFNDASTIQLAGSDSHLGLKYTGTAGANETQIRWFDKRDQANAVIANQLFNDNAGQQAAHLVFKTSNAGTLSERMRITSGSSNGATFLFNCTSDPSSSVKGSAIIPNGANGNYFQSAAATTTAYAHAQFLNTNGVVGSIQTSGSATSYNTSSDYRLKENVVDLDGAITRVKQLAPKRFNFIADDTKTVDGFLAHEAQTVVPEAVTGSHNEVDDDGNPVYQGIDQSKLVPLLTAALQEAIAKIETLETKVAALEAG